MLSELGHEKHKKKVEIRFVYRLKNGWHEQCTNWAENAHLNQTNQIKNLAIYFLNHKL